MPRKRGANAAQTKKNLLAAATKEFLNKGYDHASLRSICSRAGVTTGALYFFYDSKEALFKAVLEPLVNPIYDIITGAYDFSADPRLKDYLGKDSLKTMAVANCCYEHLDITKVFCQNRFNPVVESMTNYAAQCVSNHVLSELKNYGDTVDNNSHSELLAQWYGRLCVDSIFLVLSLELSKADAIKQLGLMTIILNDGLASLKL